MAALVQRCPGFPKLRRGRGSVRGEDRYIVSGVTSYQEAADAAGAQVPGLLEFSEAGLSIPRRELAVDPLSEADEDTVFIAVADYGHDVEPVDVVREEAEATAGLAFSISTTSERRYYALETRAQYGDSLPLGGVIGVQPDGGLAGVDVPVAQGEITVPAWVPAARVTQEYVRTLQQWAGKATNLAPYGPWQRGELLYLGAQGEPRRDGDWRIVFRFATQLGGAFEIPGPPGFDSLLGTKRGWDYVDVTYEDYQYEDAELPLIVKVPRCARVLRLFEEINFATELEIPGA